MLTLHEPGADVRERFLAGELDAPASAEHVPLLSRWSRAKRQGVAADSGDNGAVLGSRELQERRQRLTSLLHVERSLLEPLGSDLSSRSLVSLVADADGVVLHRRGGGDFADAARAVRLVEGACWSEGARGTNAIGTALTERAPVAVLGGAHFERRNADLFCYAAPIRDAHGNVLCVLDVSGTMAAHDPAVSVAVRASATALELLLRDQAFANLMPGGLSALSRLVERLSEPAFVLDLQQNVLCSSSRARTVLHDLGWSTDAAPLRLSLPAARAGTEQLLLGRGKARAYQLGAEPLCDAHGRPLAYLMTVRSPEPGRGPRPRAAVSGSRDALASIMGSDPALQREKSRAQLYAATELPVLLLAETGTGKELFARAIHAASPRSQGPFVAVNCGSMTESLLESELFGHAPHAFTGANKRGTEGKIAAADGGTLFLDEAADMSPALQSALLRFLDDGSYQRVGETETRHADVRVVCATCRDLPARVGSGQFRQDLFYRIHGACVSPPPLRERTDKLALAQQLLARQGGGELSRCAADYIEHHDWPGNVRELKSALMHARALAQGGPIERVHMPRTLLHSKQQVAARAPASAKDAVLPRKAVMREAVNEALRVTDGNLSEAARRLRMARSTLYRILRQSHKE